MLNVDVSKVLPRRSLSYLIVFLPGLFFVLSVTLGNPDLTERILSGPKPITNSNRYFETAVALFFAFVIGNGFMLVVSFVYYLWGYVYRFCERLRVGACRYLLLPILNRVSQLPSLTRSAQKAVSERRPTPWLVRWLSYVNRVLVPIAFPSNQEILDGQKAWRIIARRLLWKRYGIDLNQLGDEWHFLYESVGTPTSEEVRGPLLMMASHAMGWAGVVAMNIAPALRNKYYIGFSAAMLVFG